MREAVRDSVREGAAEKEVTEIVPAKNQKNQKKNVAGAGIKPITAIAPATQTATAPAAGGTRRRRTYKKRKPIKIFTRKNVE